MPSVCLAITQSDITVTRLIVKNVVRDIIKRTGFPADAEIYIDEKQGGQKAKAGFNNPCNIAIRPEHRNYVFVTITERFTEESVVLQREPYTVHKPVFNDKDLGVRIYPYYAQKEIELAIRFRTRDLTAMNNWIRVLRAQDGFHQMAKWHNLKYDYSLSDDLFKFIVDAHKMSETVEPRGKSLKEFIVEGFNGGLMIRKNLNGTQKQPIINEVQTGVTGFTMSDQVYNSSETEDGIYELPVPYKVRFKDIMATVLETPIIIHNQMIPSKYINGWFLNKDPEFKPFGYKPEGWLGEDVTNDEYYRFFKGDGGARLIPYDDFFPSKAREDTVTVFLAPVQVNPSDPHLCMKLSDIGDEHIPATIKKVIELTGSQGNYRESIISVELHEVFENERILETAIDSDGLVKTKAPMLLDRRNYLKIDLLKDLTLTSSETIDMLLKEGTLMFDLCKLLDPRLKLSDTFVSGQFHININNHITRESYIEWLRGMKFVNKAFKDSLSGGVKVRQISSILAKRS